MIMMWTFYTIRNGLGDTQLLIPYSTDHWADCLLFGPSSQVLSDGPFRGPGGCADHTQRTENITFSCKVYIYIVKSFCRFSVKEIQCKRNSTK